MKALVKNGTDYRAMLYKGLCDAAVFDEDTLSLADSYKKLEYALAYVPDEELPAVLEKANNEAEIVKIQADSAEYQGQKDAAIMSNLGKQLNDYPELIQYYMITGWDGILPETMLSDDMNMLFNIDPVTNKKTSTSEQ